MIPHRFNLLQDDEISLFVCLTQRGDYDFMFFSTQRPRLRSHFGCGGFLKFVPLFRLLVYHRLLLQEYVSYLLLHVCFLVHLHGWWNCLHG